MRSKKVGESVSLELNDDEALVLFEWLSQFNKKQNASSFQDQAEERVLFDLEAILEESLTEIFERDYSSIILRARQNVRDEE